jgi:predicted nucleotidyltransferase
MVTGKDKQLIYEKIREYVKTLEKNNVPVWRLYLYGSYSKNTFHPDSDIDLAVFWDRDDIDGLDEDVRLRMLSWDIDLRIEPHSFARTDFDETDPFVREILLGVRTFAIGIYLPAKRYPKQSAFDGFCNTSLDNRKEKTRYF